MRLSLEQKQQRLEQLAGFSLEVLRTASARELREFAKGFIKNYTKLNREQLLEGLISFSEDARVTKELEVEAKRVQEQAKAEEVLLAAREQVLNLEAATLPDASPEALGRVYRLSDQGDLEDYGQQLYSRIKDIAYDSLLQVKSHMEAMFKLNRGITILATQVISAEIQKYPKISTRKSRRTAYLNALKASYRADVDSDNKQLILSGIESLTEILFATWKDETVAFDRNYQQQVKETNEERVELDPTDLLAEAKATLENPEKKHWTVLAKALAIATGRRTSEIMVSAKFEKIGDYEVRFTGRLKGRRDSETGASSAKLEETLTIPTLLKADLVVAGMTALEATGKRLAPGNDPVETCEVAHRKYQSSFNKLMSGSGRSMKDLRKIYIVVARSLFKAESMDTNRFYQNILGHDDGATSQSYNKYYLPADATENIRALVGLNG